MILLAVLHILCKAKIEFYFQHVFRAVDHGVHTRKIIIEQVRVPVVIDAGIGAPSHACEALELGADAVLVNTALATANHPESMGHAFKNAVSAGREAFLSGLGSVTNLASPTSPLTGFLAEN